LVSLTSWIEDRPTHRHLLAETLLRVSTFLSQEGLLRQQVLERCPLRRKDHGNDLSKAGIAEVTYSY